MSQSIKEFFYQNNQQPGFAFERNFPLDILEKQKEITGKYFSHSNDLYLKYSLIYKDLIFLLNNTIIFEDYQAFISEQIINLPAVLKEEHIHLFKNDLDKLRKDFSQTEIDNFLEYLNENLEKAYSFYSSSISFQIWSTWFRKYCSYSTLRDILQFNQDIFQQAHDTFVIKEIDKQNVIWLGEIFKLNEKEQNVLNAFAFDKHNNIMRSARFSSPLRATLPNVKQQIEEFAYIYDLTITDILAFFQHERLIESGLIQNSFVGKNIFSEVTFERKELNEYWNDIFLLILKTDFPNKEALVKSFINIEKDLNTSLDIEDYSYLKNDLEVITQALKNSDKPMDILFWGSPGTGKTELTRVLAKQSHKNLCNITQYDKEGRDSLYQNQRLLQLINAKNFSKTLENFIILVDEAENILQQKEIKHVLTEQLENKKVHTIWIVNHIEHIEPAYLRRFDYIQEIKGMPFNNRKSLADKLLKNQYNDLSYKIAQAMHTPAEIVAAVEWCGKTGLYTWDNIQNKMSSYQQALAKIEKNISNVNIEVIPPEQNKDKGLQNFAGYEYLHESAQQIKDLFNNPEKYQKMGSKVPKGILLAGPGVGKTLFAQCLANEIAIPLIKADSAILAINPGSIAELFKKARTHAPCMIFLDEIDVIASNVVNMFGPAEKQIILNQLLVEMEGFDPLEGVLVLGATHRDYLLDSAVKRSGRFGKTIHIRNPSLSDRIAIWKYYTEKDRDPSLLASDINYDSLGKLSATLTAADINQCVNMAATEAASKNQDKLHQNNLEEACNQIFWGTDAQGLPITKKEQWRTAIHEAGHALIALKNGTGITRATIRPHLNFLGAVELEKPEGNYSFTLEQIEKNTEILFGGMLAENTIFQNHANGVTSDLDRASSFVMQALLSYGMSKTLGSTVITGNTPQLSQERTIAIEKEHKSILDNAQNNVTQWFNDNKKILVDLALLLIEKRSLSQSELYEWFTQNAQGSYLKNLEEDNDCSFEQMAAMALSIQ